MNYNREKLIKLFENNGIFLNLDNLQEPLEMDSITYIALIIDAENDFGIEIPEEQLIYDTNFSFMMMEKLIVDIISSQGNMQ